MRADQPIDEARLTVAMRSVWQAYYCAEHDLTGLVAEANVLRYRPLERVEVRHDDAAGRSLSVLRVAAAVTGVAFDASSPDRESDLDFARRLTGSALRPDRVRLLTELDDDARRMLHAADIAIDVSAPVCEPMIELQRWIREQAISRTRHRHGRLVDTA